MAEESKFGNEMRGYRRDEVDRAVAELRARADRAAAERATAQKEIQRLLAVNEDLQAELDELGRPTYAGLGSRLESTLRIAEEQATRLIGQADIDAEELRTAASAEAAAVREAALAGRL